MIKMRVKTVGVDVRTNTPLIVLVNEEENGLIPISVGGQEAYAVAVALEGAETKRPIAYDLLKEIFEKLETSVGRVLINDLSDGIYYADLEVVKDNRKFNFDSRPSDAIALALRVDAPIFVSEQVAEEAMVYNLPEPEKEDREEGLDIAEEEFQEFLKDVKPEDFGDLDEFD